MLLKNTTTAGGVKVQNGSRGVIESFWDHKKVITYLDEKRKALSPEIAAYLLININ